MAISQNRGVDPDAFGAAHLYPAKRDQHGDPLICVHVVLPKAMAELLAAKAVPGDHTLCDSFVKIVREWALSALTVCAEAELQEVLFAHNHGTGHPQGMTS